MVGIMRGELAAQEWFRPGCQVRISKSVACFGPWGPLGHFSRPVSRGNLRVVVGQKRVKPEVGAGAVGVVGSSLLAAKRVAGRECRMQKAEGRGQKGRSGKSRKQKVEIRNRGDRMSKATRSEGRRHTGPETTDPGGGKAETLKS